jgi:hypothetical protein
MGNSLKLYTLVIFTAFIVGQAKAQVNDSVQGQETRAAARRLKESQFIYPPKQWFMQGEIMTGLANLGGRLIAGYRFHRFGILGGGVGVEGPGGIHTLLNYEPFGSYYFPVFVHYEGDLMRKRVSPWYAVELGYGFRYSNPAHNNDYINVTGMDHPSYKYLGGFKAGFRFGVKIYSFKRVYVCIAPAFDIQQATDKYSNYYYNSIGQNISVSYTSKAYLYSGSITTTIGFLGNRKPK